MSELNPSNYSYDQVSARYDEFQAEAVNNIVADYSDKLAGRYLLVIPTGGGKTFTAVKAVNRLFHQGVLDKDSDLVIWGAHREELVKQAKDTFDKYSKKHPDESYLKQIKIMGIAKVRSYVSTHSSAKIVVIDEAHHAASINSQYGPLFDYPQLGILGLTATPSRHDGEPLDFEKESYSIGFPDLVEKQIILSPEIRTLNGGYFEDVKASGVIGMKGLASLETAERDGNIIEHIAANHRDYSKLIIYAGSVSHAKSLCERMRNSQLAEHYESFDYITGNGRSGNEEDRKSFIERVKGYQRSIIVNFDVLAEGYDDPKVNAVIMARPTRSKLVYMQAAGRCIRVNPEDLSKQAYIVEVVDQLPNIRYRIDNRWLFSEISDTLEPAVDDRFFGSAEEFAATLQALFIENNVNEDDQIIPSWDKRMRYSLLLFRCYTGLDAENQPQYRHIPILIDAVNRSAVSNWFNYLSEQMEKLVKAGINPIEAMSAARASLVSTLDSDLKKRLVFDAMEEASKVASSDFDPSNSAEPWIKFVALRYRQSGLSDEIQDFIKDMVNRDQVESTIINRSFEPPSRLVRFPLPLTKYVGVFLTNEEFLKLKQVVIGLESIKTDAGNEDHRYKVRDLLANAILPISPIYADLLPAMVREEREYYLDLE